MQLEPTVLPWKIRLVILAAAVVGGLSVPTMYYYGVKLVRLVDQISHIQRAPQPAEPGVVTVGVISEPKK